MRRLEERLGQDLRDTLYRLRFIEGKSAMRIAAELGISYSTLNEYLRRFQLTYIEQSRPRGDSR